MDTQKLIDWLKEDMDAMRLDIKDDIKVLNNKVEDIVAFKWKIMGAAAAASLLGSVVIQLFLASKP